MMLQLLSVWYIILCQLMEDVIAACKPQINKIYMKYFGKNSLFKYITEESASCKKFIKI